MKLERLIILREIMLSENTAGQRMRVFDEEKTYKQGEFVVSELGMDYLTNHEQAKENIQQIIEKVKEIQKLNNNNEKKNTENDDEI